MRIVKVLALTAMVCLISTAAFAGLIMSVQAVSVSGGGGSYVDSTHVKVGVGSVVTIDVYGQLTGTDSTFLLADIWATIPETAVVTGVNGSMSYTSGSGAGRIYRTNWLGAPPTLTPNGIGSNVDMNDYDNYAFGEGSVGLPLGEACSTPIVMGEFKYTVAAIGGTYATINIVPDTAGWCDWYNGNTLIVSTEYNTVSGGPVYIGTPEPSTLILLGMGALALLVIRRRKKSIRFD